ncbi:M3 family oligoendopeptidase [soil metagenome]
MTQTPPPPHSKASSQQAATLPHWQLTSLFSSLEGEDFRAAKEELEEDLDALERFMDERGVRSQEGLELSAEVIGTFEHLLSEFNTIYALNSDIWAFVYGYLTTDSLDELSQAEYSGLQPVSSRLGVLAKRFTAWLGSLDIEALIGRSQAASEHAYLLRLEHQSAKHLMSDAEEALFSALTQTGGNAWGKLHGDISSQSTVRLALPGREEGDYTVTELKNLQAEADPELRRAAFLAEQKLLERDAVSFAAALNSIKGQVNEVSRRRGWASALDEALFQSHISRASLDAMQAACEASFPVFRRYLKAKAKFLGKSSLAWYDLRAPIAVGEARSYSWDEAKSFVVQNFRAYSDELADFAQRSFDEGWHDVPPRKGKRGGAFCMKAFGAQESRILLNYGATLDDLFTVAHELGHAYHNHCLFTAGRSSLQAGTPMTLAETASIFCETIVVNAVLKEAGETERLAILEQDLLGSSQLVVDIHSRFLFEREVFDRRRKRELSVGEFKGLMLDAQEATYGDGLDSNARHPNMWSQKLHYYSAGRSFYNFPYTFCYLFGLGVYAQYRAQPEGFRERYDRLLSMTGMADAAELARDFGIDLESPDFWQGSLAVAAGRVAEFEELVGAHAG